MQSYIFEPLVKKCRSCSCQLLFIHALSFITEQLRWFLSKKRKKKKKWNIQPMERIMFTSFWLLINTGFWGEANGYVEDSFSSDTWSSNIKNIWISWLCFEGRQMGLVRTLFSAFCYSFEKTTSFVGQFPLLNFLDWRVEICWILLFGLINIPIPGIIFFGLFWIISNLSGKTLKSAKYSGWLHFMYSDTWDSRALIQITLT